MAENPIIVALDVSAEEAVALARSLQGRVRWLKVGMTLYYAAGPRIIADLRELGFDVFCDLKLHDIPHQAAGAAAEIARLGVGMLTIHACGGLAMMQAAVEASANAAKDAGLPVPAVLAVTVLTSMDSAALADVGVNRAASDQVRILGQLARDAGVDGVVCSPHEAAEMRALFGRNAFVVTPGVRPAGAAVGDQARVATPAAALLAGASHLVIGRPITSAPEPAAAVDAIQREIREKLQ
ncbi:MAG: orotidine-5'-phosphate decarboxylase [Coriobacteriia bacterium]|nr:orotidine-5'-phosphate decarboxylase [Coriobacteriia bacterium]